MDAKSGRLVLQDGKTATAIQRRATEEHEEAKAAIEEALRGVQGAEVSGDREEKDPERVAEKVEDGQKPGTIRDYSGFRVAVETPEAWKQSAAALRAHFEVPEEQDQFEKGSEEHFHGHTVQIRLPGSKATHEVQILPREVADTVDRDHALYEKARDGDAKAAQALKDTNRERWIAFLERNGTAKYKLGSTQVELPAESEAGAALEAARSKIRDEDLAGKGRDVGGSHVTLRYGIEGGDPEETRDYLRRQAPFDLELGPTEIFPPSPNTEGAAVVMAPVTSPELHRMHTEIAGHGNFVEPSFPDYRPHATVAYVKPEAAGRYRGMRETAGKRAHAGAVSLTFRDGTSDAVRLDGAPANSPAARLAALRARSSGRGAPQERSWKKGDWFVAPNAEGGLEAGVVRYWGQGYEGKKRPVGRIQMSGGTQQKERPPRSAVPVMARNAMLQPVTGTEREAEILQKHGPELGRMAAEYLAKHTKDGATVIATDAAQQMIPEYRENPLGADGDTKAIGAAIHDAALATMLAQEPDPQRSRALIEVGTPGSGKTTGVALGGERAGFGLRVEMIPEHANKLDAILTSMLAAGWQPVIEWVHAGKPEATVDRMVNRAMGTGERAGLGRVVPVRYMAGAWEQLPKTIEAARKQFGRRIAVVTVDNSGKPGEAKAEPGLAPGMERMTAAAAGDRMKAELDRLNAAGRFAGPEGAATLAAALDDHEDEPRKETAIPATAAQGLREKMRASSPPADSGWATDSARRAWSTAGAVLRDDPEAQVPF